MHLIGVSWLILSLAAKAKCPDKPAPVKLIQGRAERV
jgi:hypothetical protein